MKMKWLLVFICVVGLIGLSGCHSPEAKTTVEPAAIPDTPASLPISASVNLSPYSEAEEFHNPKYQAATEGCVHASAGILLSENQTVSLILESDCAIDWCRDWENPGLRVAILFSQMITYVEDSGWSSIYTRAIEAKHIISFNEGRRLEVLITVHPDNSGASIPNIYKLLAINLDPNKSHSLKYSVSPHSGESSKLPPTPSSKPENSFQVPEGGSTAASPPAESSIDKIFLSRWGHTYYNDVPRVSFSSFDIDKLILQTSFQIPWQLCYQPGVFDCSEMTAYLEYMLERHGYTAQICQGETTLGKHAWVLVYNNVARCWIPIEATSPVGTLDPILFYILTGGMAKDHYSPRWRWEDIYDVRRISEYDWWNSPYADQLVAASDRAQLSEPLPPLPEIKKPELPPLPEIKPPKLPPLPDWPLPDLKEEEEES